MQYDKVYSFMVNKLETGLPNYIIYHNAPHTISVISAAEQLGKSENISGEDLVLLKTAALFHDCGFITLCRVYNPQSDSPHRVL